MHVIGDFMKKIMQQVYRKNSIGGVSVAFRRMANSGYFDKFEMKTLEMEKITHGLDFAVIREYVKEIKNYNPDLIHIRGTTDDGLLALIAARIAGVKHILMGVEGMYSDTYEISKIKKLIARYIIEPLSFTLATDVFTVYEGALYRPKIKRYKRKLRGYVYNSMPIWDVSDRDSVRTKLRTCLGIGQDSKVILLLSRINYDKGFSYFCDALEKLDKEWPEKLEFLVVGEGEYLEKLKERCSSLDNVSKIHIVGPKRNVREYYLCSDVYATFTLHENHSLSILEACSAHLPSIVTETGGNSETIENEKSGWVIPIKSHQAIIDSIKKVSTINCEILSKMGEYAYSSGIAKFAPDIVYRRLSNLYSDIMK